MRTTLIFSSAGNTKVDTFSEIIPRLEARVAEHRSRIDRKGRRKWELVEKNCAKALRTAFVLLLLLRMTSVSEHALLPRSSAGDRKIASGKKM